eukprot:353227-Chlamydomonas_euryale.AAC.2
MPRHKFHTCPVSVTIHLRQRHTLVLLVFRLSRSLAGEPFCAHHRRRPTLRATAQSSRPPPTLAASSPDRSRLQAACRPPRSSSLAAALPASLPWALQRALAQLCACSTRAAPSRSRWGKPGKQRGGQRAI